MVREGMAIGELARRTDSSVGTIRYYERLGLLPSPRRQGRYRRYGVTDVRRLGFVRRARELGFTLCEVRALLKLSAIDGGDVCVEVRKIGMTQLTKIRARIEDLQTIEHELADAISRCDVDARSGCALLSSISTGTGTA